MKRIVLITGASRGIGYETALALAEDKDNRVIATARNKEGLQKLKDQSDESNNTTIEIINGDLTDAIFRKEIENYIEQKHSELNILINNAGVLLNRPFKQVSEEEIQMQFQVNVFAPMLIIQSLLPLMKGSGHIVNISSMGGFQGSAKFPGLSVYSSAKGALALLTECLAEEYKETGLSFNALALGAVQTEMLEEAFPGFKAPVSPKEMGNYIADFAINGSKFFNGKIIPVSVNTP